MGEHDEMTVEELKDEARERGIEGFSSMRKAELIDALEGGEGEAVEEAAEVAFSDQNPPPKAVVSVEGEAEEELGQDGENPVTSENPLPKATLG